MSSTPPDNFDQFLSSKLSPEEEVLDLRRQMGVLNRQLRLLRAGEQIIRNALAQIFSTAAPIVVPKPALPDRKPKSEIAVAHISDTQLGKETESYNMDVARDRLMLFARKIVEITQARRSHASIDECRVYLGGDLVEGENIFPGQAHQIDVPLLEQAVKLGPMIFVSMLTYLLANFERVIVHAVPGNHGSTGKFNHPATNWDTVCAIVVQALLGKQDRLSYTIHERFHFVDRLPGGWGNLVVHGHQIRGGFGGFPFYGVCVPEDHEILTRVGWKLHQQLKVGEDVLVFDPNTHENRWEPVTDINIHDYDGELLSINRPGHSISFTPDHKWPTTTGGLVAAKDLNTTHWLPIKGEFFGRDSALSPRLAAILGWVVTDGYARWVGNHWEALVYQHPSKFLDEIVELLGTEPRKPHPETGVVPIGVALADSKAIAAIYKSKDDLPALVCRLSREAAEAMFDAMLKAEASFKPESTYFSQQPGPVLEAFQILSILVGKTVWPTIDGEGMGRACLRKSQRLRPTWGTGMVSTPFRGKVWCPTTTAGTWWVRHGGMALPTGNSKKISGWSDSIDEPWDYLWFGHYHTFGKLVINHRLWLSNGTTESGNEYALEQIASRNVPCQRLAFFNASHGLIDDCQVYLDKRTPQSKRFK